MDDVFKGMLIILILMYVISPLDACPGPVDDMLVMLIGFAAQRRMNERE